VAEHWTLRLRQGPKVTKRRFGSLEAALDGLAAAVDAAGPQRLPTARAFVREIEPVKQVALRAEIAGPQRFFASVNGGVDVRGDGSPEAFTGRVNRDVVERRDGESAVDALRRILTSQAGPGG
jgi:hypothetical protein